MTTTSHPTPNTRALARFLMLITAFTVAVLLGFVAWVGVSGTSTQGPGPASVSATP